MNTRELIRAGASELEQAGVPDPAYDSALLLSHVMKRPQLELRAGTDPEPTPAQELAYRRLLNRRLGREPLQYILGSVLFCGMELRVRPGVLIPRPETELLAEWAEELLKDSGAPEILDLCCGSGCLGLALKRMIPEAAVTLSDLSPDAAALAEENRQRLGLEAEILRGDLLEPSKGRTYDLILCNPPYIASGECDSLQPEVMLEPRMALDGGQDGLDFYRRIAAEVPGYLKPAGRLMLEVGDGEAPGVIRILRDRGAVRTAVREDYSGTERMVLAEYVRA